MQPEPSRQVHLDFHTSELIPDIGGSFSTQQFQDALRAGHVNQINVFAKCHHSWSYYPTKAGNRHPNLTTDLLGAQIAACHEIGVAAPVYFTVGWSAHDAEQHPEWCLRDRSGDFVAFNWPEEASPGDRKPTFQWKDMCVGTGYHKLILAQVEEICRGYEVDGFWFDIYNPNLPCFCEACRAGMARAKVNEEDGTEVERYRAHTVRDHCQDLLRLIGSFHPEASVYFNGLTVLERAVNFRYRLHDANTKNDLEDLPSAWGGYDKFPLRSKVFHREHKPIVAMSGKFHGSWGEFGGFKDPSAMRFEAAAMISFGASCNFGDQLHPSGIMDMNTYENIGHAFRYVEKIEEYGIGGLPASSLGLWVSHDADADQGLALMLLEEQTDFAAVGPGDDLSAFQTIVVPSARGTLAECEQDLRVYLRGGGTLLVLGEGALDPEGASAVVECGADYLGQPRYDMDYTLAGDELQAGGRDPSVAPGAAGATPPGALPYSPFLNYQAGLRWKPHSDTRVLASIREPYFSRTYGSYCGHQNTPPRLEDANTPAAWRSGNVIVTAHALDRIYSEHGAPAHRKYFARLLRLLHTKPMVEVDLPTAGRVSLLRQETLNRYVAHLLYGSPIARGKYMVIEDLPTLSNVPVRLRLPGPVAALQLIPDGVPLPIRVMDGNGEKEHVVETTVPKFAAHCAVVATLEQAPTPPQAL